MKAAGGSSRLAPLVVVAVAATLLAQVMGAVAHLALAVLASEAAPDYGVSADLIGVYSSLIFLAAAVTALATAGLHPRWGGVRLIQLALMAGGAGLLLLLVPHWAALIPSAFLVGAGYGPLTVASSHILARAAPPRLFALIFSVKQTGVPIGYALAGSLLPAIALAAGWRAAMAAAAVASFGLAAALQLVRPRLDADRTGGGWPGLSLAAFSEPLGLVRRTPGLRRMAIASLVFAGAQIGIASFLVVYLQGQAGLDLQRAGLVLSAANLVAIAGRIGWGAVADRLGGGQTLIALLGLGIAAAIGLVLLIGPGWPYAAALWAGGFVGATVFSWNGVFVAETARQSPPGRVSEATGGVFTVTYLGMVVGPAALSALFTMLGSPMIGFMLLAMVVATVSAAFVIRPLPAGDKAARPAPHGEGSG